MVVKSELIEQVSQNKNLKGLQPNDIEDAVNHILEQVGDTLEKKGRVEIRGFGSFDTRTRAPRKAHNPKTGKKLVTEEKTAIHFKPGKDLKERVDALKETHKIED